MSWQTELKTGFTHPQPLLEFLNISVDKFSLKAHRDFKTKVPLSFAKRMQKGNLNCPLLKQVLPIEEEETITPGFTNDPLEEQQANPIPGLLHKYASRVLITLATNCAINCRYCFRRHFPYSDNQISTRHWHNIFAYLQLHPEIDEVILSGGDPLLVNNSQLKKFIDKLEKIPSIKIIRLHSRLPIVLPSRLDEEFLATLNQCKLRVVLVVHCNHPNEINQEVENAFAAITNSKITLLNQSVLLQGINDKPEILAALSHQLFTINILPYYLHLPDKVQNTAHFDVDETRAIDIHHQLHTLLPGYLVPRLVKEEPGKSHKTPI